MFEPRDSRRRSTGRPGQQGRLPVSTGGGDEVHLLDRLAVIYRHRRLVVSVFTIVVTLMMLQSYSTIPLYRATARMLIEDERVALVAGMDSNDPIYWVDPEPYFETQYRILQSPGLAQYTIQRLDLSQVPELSGEALMAFGPLEAIRAARTSFAGWARTIGTGVLRFIRPDAVVAPVAEDEMPARPAETSSRGANFNSRIQVSPVTGTRLVDISFTSTDPVFAAAAINAHVETYLQRNLDHRLEAVRQTLGWLSDEVAKQQAAVEASNRALAEYRESQDALSLNSSTDIVTTRLASLNDSVLRAEANRLQWESLHTQVADLDPESDAAVTFPAVAQSPGVIQITARLAQLETDKVRLSGRYLARHPEIVKITSEIASARLQVTTEVRRAIQAIRIEYQSALDEEQRLRREFDQQQRRAADLSRKEVGYGVLERQAESYLRVYESLLQQQAELQVVVNSRANNVRVIDLAPVPSTPFSPNARRDWRTAVAIGLLFAVGLLFVVEYLDDTIKTPDDVGRRLHLPMLGLVPVGPGAHPPVLSAEVSDEFGEAFRSLRTSLVFTAGGSSSRIIGVTSTQPREGKTICVANLGLVLALGGARVLLIDADMRLPALHKSLGLANSVGLSHVLVGQARIREAIQRTHDPNLFVVTAGQPPPNPSELLASDRMRNLLASLATGPFDWIILDTPPVLAVTDSVILAPLLSGMVFVVGAEMTRSAHALRAVEMLKAGGNVIGVVLNRVDFARNRYYYSRYYGYTYKNYYGNTSTAA